MNKLFYVDACLRDGSNTKKIASSDRLVIAAPFWDMSFSSALKVFFENMSLFNVTFANDEKRLKLCDVF